MNKLQINSIAHNYVDMSKDDKEVINLEQLGCKIVPYNVTDEWELQYLISVNLLNFYEPDIKIESPLTYNLIITEIANIIKNQDQY